jgi:hypothetical protein
MSNKRFQPGDKVVAIGDIYSYYKTGTEFEVIAYFSNRTGNIHVRTDYGYTSVVHESEIELLSIFQSPLYKALS